MQQLKPQLRMFFFIIGRIFKQRRDLLVAILFRLGRIVGILVAGLAFTGECGHQILFSLCAFQIFHVNLSFSLAANRFTVGNELTARLCALLSTLYFTRDFQNCQS